MGIWWLDFPAQASMSSLGPISAENRRMERPQLSRFASSPERVRVGLGSGAIIHRPVWFPMGCRSGQSRNTPKPGGTDRTFSIWLATERASSRLNPVIKATYELPKNLSNYRERGIDCTDLSGGIGVSRRSRQSAPDRFDPVANPGYV